MGCLLNLRSTSSLTLIATNLRSNHKNGYVNVVVSGQATHPERLHDVFHDRLEEDEEPVPYKPIPMELSEGFVDKELKILVYTDHQLFERYHRFRLKEGFRKNKEALTIKELMALEVGDFVCTSTTESGSSAGSTRLR